MLVTTGFGWDLVLHGILMESVELCTIHDRMSKISSSSSVSILLTASFTSMRAYVINCLMLVGRVFETLVSGSMKHGKNVFTI